VPVYRKKPAEANFRLISGLDLDEVPGDKNTRATRVSGLNPGDEYFLSVTEPKTKQGVVRQWRSPNVKVPMVTLDMKLQ
jgi:hypothetical protein